MGYEISIFDHCSSKSKASSQVQNQKVCSLSLPTAKRLRLQSADIIETAELPSTFFKKLPNLSYQLRLPLLSPITMLPLCMISKAVGSWSSLNLWRGPENLISYSQTELSLPIEKKVLPTGWNRLRVIVALLWRLISCTICSEWGSHSFMESLMSRELLRMRLLQGCQQTELTPQTWCENFLLREGTDLALSFPKSMIRHLLSLIPQTTLVWKGDRQISSTPSWVVCTLFAFMSSILGPFERSTYANTPFLSAARINLPSQKQLSPPRPPWSLLQQKSLIFGSEASMKLMSPLSDVLSYPSTMFLLSLRNFMLTSFSLTFLRL